MNENDLKRKLLKADADTLSVLWKAHSVSILNLAFRILQDRDAAEDLDAADDDPEDGGGFGVVPDLPRDRLGGRSGRVGRGEILFLPLSLSADRAELGSLRDLLPTICA